MDDDCVELRDCIKDPVRKECRKFCLERMLRKANPEEKRIVLGYTDETADAIFKAYNDDDHYIYNYEDLARWLTPQQQDEILTKFDQINQFRLDYFQLPSRERERVLEQIKKGQINMDDNLSLPLPG